MARSTLARQTWDELVGDDTMWEDVVGRYREAHRSYHTLDHVDQVLGVLVEVDEHEPAVLLAAVLHDVVYDPRRGDNEALSAEYARNALAHLDPAVVERTADLILATASHADSPSDRGRAALIDADLSILGAPPHEYDRYAAGIRAEYAHVPEDAYRRGRSAVLEGFLVRDRLYTLDELHQRLDARARSNLIRELTGLK